MTVEVGAEPCAVCAAGDHGDCGGDAWDVVTGEAVVCACHAWDHWAEVGG